MTMATAPAGRRMGLTPNGCRNRSRSRLPNMAFRRATAAPISRTSFYCSGVDESFTPFWSIWDPVAGASICRGAMMNIQLLALQAIYDYWFREREQ